MRSFGGALVAWFEVGHRLFDLFGTETVVCIRFCLMLAGILRLFSRTLPWWTRSH